MSRKIFIMGASTGIGKALAKRYANKDTILGLAARRVDLLENVAASCRKNNAKTCLLYTSPSPRDGLLSRMPSSA